MILQEELKKLPEKPGVYIMHDANDAIIYVGKAISLRNRVQTVFSDQAMMKGSKKIRWYSRSHGLNILSRIQNWKRWS